MAQEILIIVEKIPFHHLMREQKKAESKSYTFFQKLKKKRSWI